MWRRIRARTLRATAVGLATLLPIYSHAEGIDTEHLFGFMIGTDVGTVGEREFQSQTTGRFAKDGGRYRGVGQEFELEFVPVKNFRVEIGSAFAGHDIRAVDMASVNPVRDRQGLLVNAVQAVAASHVEVTIIGRGRVAVGLPTYGNRRDEIHGVDIVDAHRVTAMRELVCVIHAQRTVRPQGLEVPGTAAHW